MGQFGIRRKISVLIVSILIIEVTFCAALYLLFQNSHRLLEEERRARQLLESAASVGRQLSTAFGALPLNAEFGSKNGNSREPKNFAEVRKELNLLRQQGRDAQEKDAINSFSEIVERLMTQYLTLQDQISNRERYFSKDTLMMLVQQGDLQRQYNQEWWRFRDLLNSRLNNLTAEESKLRRSIEYGLVIGLLANIAIAITLSLVLGRQIATRLEMLALDTEKYADGEKVEPRVLGNDEIGMVESAFHEMAEIISKARETEQAIIKSLSIGLIVTDSNLSIQSINPKACAMFDTTSDALSGQAIGSLFEVDDEEAFHKELISKTSIVNIMGKRGSNRFFHAECDIQTLPVNAEQYLVSVVDITDRIEADQLKQELVSMLSHDLRTPLANIRATLDQFSHHQENAESSKLQMDLCDGAKDDIDRMLRLIHDLLDISRMESGKFPLELKEVPLWAPFERTVKAIAALAEKKGVTISCEDNDLEVLADSDRLEQVLINLLANAIKATEGGGSVSLTARNSGSAVIITVSDTGCGIEESDLPFLFNKFYRPEAKADGDGHGLGLAICKTIIDQHAGSIQVESAPGQGATFYITLPATVAG